MGGSHRGTLYTKLNSGEEKKKQKKKKKKHDRCDRLPQADTEMANCLCTEDTETFSTRFCSAVKLEQVCVNRKMVIMSS